MVAKSLLSKNQNLKNSDIRLYRVFLMHHSNVIKRIITNNGVIRQGDEAMWLGCNLKNELEVLENELVDLILLAD